jgi:pimeloyl-ACP methyl ester carboxylesterase
MDPGEDYGRWLQHLVPTAIVELWPGMGHYLHLVDPARFLARLGEFESKVRG